MKKLIALLVLLAASSHAAIVRVNGSSANASGSATTIAAPATSLTTGNLQLVGWRSGGTTVTSVTDTAGNTYTLEPQITQAGLAVGGWGFCLNATGNASNVVTINFSGSATFRDIVIAQYSGVASLDVVATGNKAGSGTSLASGSFTTANARDLLWGFMTSTGGNTFTAGTGYTTQTTTSNGEAADMDALVTAIQSSVTLNATIGSSNAWIMVGGAFKATDVVFKKARIGF